MGSGAVVWTGVRTLSSSRTWCPWLPASARRSGAEGSGSVCPFFWSVQAFLGWLKLHKLGPRGPPSKSGFPFFRGIFPRSLNQEQAAWTVQDVSAARAVQSATIRSAHSLWLRLVDELPHHKVTPQRRLLDNSLVAAGSPAVRVVFRVPLLLWFWKAKRNTVALFCGVQTVKTKTQHRRQPKNNYCRTPFVFLKPQLWVCLFLGGPGGLPFSFQNLNKGGGVPNLKEGTAPPIFGFNQKSKCLGDSSFFSCLFIFLTVGEVRALGSGPGAAGRAARRGAGDLCGGPQRGGDAQASHGSTFFSFFFLLYNFIFIFVF